MMGTGRRNGTARDVSQEKAGETLLKSCSLSTRTSRFRLGQELINTSGE
jgi:hypothetical protein